MTTIAYKDGVLAADRLATAHHWTFETTKIRRLTDGRLVAGAGEFPFVLAMYGWLEAGAVHADFPSHQRDATDWQPILVVLPDGRMQRYERTPFPMEVHGPFYAAGSGRDYALMAMHLGKTAAEAVALAAEMDPATGRKVDTLTVPLVQDTWRNYGRREYSPLLTVWPNSLEEPGGRVPGRA